MQVARRSGVVVSLDDTLMPHRLHVDVQNVPVDKELDEISTIIATFLQNYSECIMVHVRHVETLELTPPDLSALLMITGTLLQLRSVIETKVCGILIQGTRIDERVLVAKELFLNLYKPSMPLDIVSCDDEVRRFTRTILSTKMR